MRCFFVYSFIGDQYQFRKPTGKEAAAEICGSLFKVFNFYKLSRSGCGDRILTYICGLITLVVAGLLALSNVHCSAVYLNIG